MNNQVCEFLKVLIGSPCRDAKRVLKKYRHAESFMEAFLNATPDDARWVFCRIFDYHDFGAFSWEEYPILKEEADEIEDYFNDNMIQVFELGYDIEEKANRIKYWPDIEKRLLEIKNKFPFKQGLLLEYQ